MKRSRSGTRSSRRRRRLNKQSLLLALTALVALAFGVSFALGLGKRRGAPVTRSSDSGVVETAAAPGRIEIFNATERSGLARFATNRLREAGYDVVYFGNADELSHASVVLDRVGRQDIARAVAKALQIDSVRVAIDTTRYVEATVVLGRNWGMKD